MLLRSVVKGIKPLLNASERNAEIEAEVRSFLNRQWSTGCGME
jgi:hypothetical protein